jgi:hypothetical protein
MVDVKKLEDTARNAAAANIFRHMATDESANRLLQQIRALPDERLNEMARLSGVPEDQLHIHRAMARGEDNAFTDELSAVDGLLQSGDIILMTGKSLGSQNLVRIQRAAYSQARSSHVALVHADFIGIDAMPKIGVTNRIISDILDDVEDNWRVIRCKRVQPGNFDMIARACAFYLAQPYKISPSKKPAKTFSYCSELARKVYGHCGITGSGIPNNLVVKPADFDRLADGHPEWIDVTEIVRPAVDFCSKYPELVTVAAAMFIDGLKLNRKRFDDRAAMLEVMRKATAKGLMSREKLVGMTRTMKDIESNLNHSFWDVTSTG